ncbi:large subunit ribosomal protein L22e [Nematocida homosporus]|uniref:large subunit ribosomal protein L22e n=1 Tax=Nematocida homosporus TaxID=1912981 RepID=UPI00222013D6|nr:large subunit ribosomal protein L22e [Nematocida homosporus]KAI5186277.1 large subunit ribosomal protein L22e [Nematocida homosporus]
MARKRIFNGILETRKQLEVSCKEVIKDDIFDMEECANFIETKQKLTRHSPDTLPGGPLNVSVNQAEAKIVLDLGVIVRRVYIKQLVLHYLQKKALRDWIHVKVDEKGQLGLHYYQTE